MVNWKLRRADPQDAPALALCVSEAYRSDFPTIGRPVSSLVAYYAEQIALYQVWVVIEQGEIIGGVVLIPKEDHMLLANIAVRPEYQGRGVGRALLELADDEALGQGYLEIRLYTNKAMTENIDMYRRSGWIEMQNGKQGGYRISMRKSLRLYVKSRR